MLVNSIGLNFTGYIISIGCFPNGGAITGAELLVVLTDSCTSCYNRCRKPSITSVFIFIHRYCSTNKIRDFKVLFHTREERFTVLISH
ncbi:hypothetical protein Hanom_Chr02g00147741 [Helianthus anomalus]